MEAWSRFLTMKTKNDGWDQNLFWSVMFRYQMGASGWPCFLNIKSERENFKRQSFLVKFGTALKYVSVCVCI